MKSRSSRALCAVVGLACITGMVGCGNNANTVEGTPPTAADIAKDTRVLKEQPTPPGGVSPNASPRHTAQ